MPSNYWFHCANCGQEFYRYRNLKKCIHCKSHDIERLPSDRATATEAEAEAKEQRARADLLAQVVVELREQLAAKDREIAELEEQVKYLVTGDDGVGDVAG